MELWMSTNSQQVTDTWLWQFIIDPWHPRWYRYKNFIALCTNNIHDLEKDGWLFVQVIDHVGIYGSKVAEGLSAFNVGLVDI